MKVIAWIVMIWTIIGGIGLLAELFTGIDVETNLFAMLYMGLILYVAYPMSKRK